MSNTESLRLLIRRKLADGTLPHDSIPRFWGGPSDGEECDGCDKVINAQQLLMEAISTTTNRGIQFHVECFYIWDSERDAPGRIGVYDKGWSAAPLASRPGAAEGGLGTTTAAV